MRPRHLIKSAVTYCRKGDIGFKVLTKNGYSAFPLSNKRACDYSLRKISQQLPHMKEELTSQLLSGVDSDDLKKLMVGRYIYGQSIEAMVGRMIVKILV